MADDSGIAPDPPYWAAPAEQLLASLGSRATGLAAAEVEARRREHGPNTLGDARRSGVLAALATQLRNPLAWLLIFAALVSGVAREWTDAVVVVAILGLSAVLGMLQERRASKAVDELRARIASRTRVLRDGAEQTIASADLVPGDVVLLSAGSLVPADAVVLEAKDFFVTQAVLTGETFPVEKRAAPTPAAASLAERTNVVFLGTSVRSGTARVVVARTGRRTEFGAIAGRLQLRPPETEFDRGIRRFGYLLTRVMFVLVILVFAGNVLYAKPALESLLFAIALSVGIAPEMLPAILSITLSHGARKMAGLGVIVRNLSAIENLGSMDVLCTDKTGTLTEGAVKLGGAVQLEGVESARVLELAYWNAALETGLVNPLDEAIREAGKALPSAASPPEKLDEIPYDFVRKRMSVVVRDGARRLMVTKGALESVLGVCSHARGPEGAVPLGPEERERVLERFRAWSTDGVRVLGLATRELDDGHASGRNDEAAMTLEGYLLFSDPPKPGVERVVADLRSLGVELKIVTGDQHDVAAHVARAVGIEVRGVLTGREIAAMHDEALWHAAERTTIFAEVDPNQKEKIILALRKTSHVVGYMGDGINDAPALHAADVDISVDSAVDVAREAASFVLLRHDLDTLRAGIVEGRATFANTMKYILTTESANFGNMLSMAVASAFLPFLPLLATQVLLNNFLSDVPAMTIARDAVDPEMVAGPRRWDLKFVRRFMIVFGLVSSTFDALTFVLLAAVLSVTPDTFRTAWFVESLLTELLVALVVRTRRAFWRSRPSTALFVSTLAVALIAVVLPYSPLATLFGFVALPPLLLALLVGITVAYMLTVETLKRALLARLERPSPARPA